MQRYHKQHLFSGSFCRHREIIFLKDLPYFFTISLSVMPVSRDGGSFCSVSIKTCKHQRRFYSNVTRAKTLKLHTAAFITGQKNWLCICSVSLTTSYIVPQCSHLHWWVFVIRCSPCGKLNGCDSKAPNICFEIITPHLQKQKSH